MKPPRTMRSWQFHEFGSIRNLRLASVAYPQPQKDEAVVRIAYAGLNPADRFLVMGRYPGAGKPPFSVGRDGCGTIVHPGPQKRFAVGDRVVFLRGIVGILKDGTLAEYVAVPEAHLGVCPAWWNDEDGAAGTLVLLTAWQGFHQARVKAGERLLITGASGGVGQAALVLAKTLQLETIALSRCAGKRDRLAEMGADHILDPEDPKLVEKVKRLGGADIILEMVGGDFLARSLAMANEFGRICIIGALGGVQGQIDLMQMIFKRLELHGIQNNSYTDEQVHQAWSDIQRHLESIQAKVPIDRIFPFEQVQEAFEHLRQGPMGKVVVGPMISASPA